MKILKICILLLFALKIGIYGQVVHTEDYLHLNASDILLSGDSIMVSISFQCLCCTYAEGDNTLSNCEPNSSHLFFSETDLYSASIISGREGGTLVGENERGDSLGSIAVLSRFNNSSFTLTTQGKENDNIDTIVVRVSMKMDPYLSQDITLYVFPVPKLHVSLEPDTIAVGDTANVVTKRELVNGDLIDLPDDQLYEAEITEGVGLCNLSTSDTAGIYINNKPGPFKFCTTEDSGIGEFEVLVGIDDLATTIAWFQNYTPASKTSNTGHTMYGDFKKKLKARYNGKVQTFGATQGNVTSTYTGSAKGKTKCDDRTPSGINDITDDLFNIQHIDNNKYCGIVGSNTVGSTMFVNTEIIKEIKNLDRSFYVTMLQIPIVAGICKNNLVALFPDATLIEYKNGSFYGNANFNDSATIVSMIKDFSRFEPQGGISVGSKLHYYPSTEISVHEDTHVAQDTSLAKIEYKVALEKIKEIKLKIDYCRDKNLSRLISNGITEAKNFITKAGNNVVESIIANSVERENEAYYNGYYEIQYNMIPKLKEMLKNLNKSGL